MPQTGINKIFLLGEILSEPTCSNELGKPKEYHFTLSTKELIPKKEFSVDHFEYHAVKVSEECIADSRSLVIGQLVHIEGKIHTYSSVNFGIKRYQTEILVSHLHHIK